MKKILCGMVSLFLACGIVWAETVTVYDVGVEPDSLNKKVNVTYRLAETGVGVANVAMDISSDAGGTWAVPANTFYPGSDIGPGIPADGSLRRLTWDARTDWNNQYSTQMMVRLVATAGPMQNGLYFAAGDKVYRMNLDGSALTVVCSGLSKPEMLALDGANNKLMIGMWFSGSQVLGYDTLRGGNASLLFNGPGSTGAQGMAFDPATSTLFYGLYYNGLYKMDLQSYQGWQHLVTASALSPMYGQRGQLDIDPIRQQVYFRSTYNGYCDECRWIWRVNYDGTGLTKIIKANGGDSIAVDAAAGYLYFSDLPGENTIKRANLDGSGVETILTLPAPYYCRFFVLDVPGNKMYIYLTSESSNWKDRTIARANLDGSNFEVLQQVTGVTDGWGIVLDIR